METEYAWAAGFIDGEGCISALKQKRAFGRTSYALDLAVSQKHREPLDKLQAIFGCGSLRPRGDGAWQWSARNTDAQMILDALMPYLSVKREQAAFASNWIATLGDGEFAYHHLQYLKRL